MKKIFLLLISVLLIIPSISFATSGACSSHEGVNCFFGALYSGKVQCNDGWENSSVNFSDADECKQVKCDITQVGLSNINNGMSGSPMGSALVQRCEDYNRKIDTLNATSGVDLPQISTDDLLNRKMQEFCIDTYGINSSNDWTNKKCVCNSGYMMDLNKKCILKQEVYNGYCKPQHGENSIALLTGTNSFKCLCVEGFDFGKDNKCVQVSESSKVAFDKAFDEIYYKALNDNPDFPKNLDKDVIKKMAITPEYRNTPIWDVMRKYCIDNNLLVLVAKKENTQSIPVKKESLKTIDTIESIKENISDDGIESIDNSARTQEELKALNGDLKIISNEASRQKMNGIFLNPVRKIWSWFIDLF